jgi:hypothetical protein
MMGESSMTSAVGIAILSVEPWANEEALRESIGGSPRDLSA